MKPTFIAFLRRARVRYASWTLDPIELALHVVDDRAGLHRVRQHVHVGLDLELRRLLVLVELQRVLDREARRLEVLADLVEEHGHVHVRAPLALLLRIRLERSERVFEVQIAIQLAVDLLDRLCEIHGLGERAHRGDCLLGDVRHAQCRGFCSLNTGMPLSASFCSEAPMSSYSTAWWQMS